MIDECMPKIFDSQQLATAIRIRRC